MKRMGYTIAWVSVLSENEEKEEGFRTTADALGNDLDLMESPPNKM